MVRIGMVNYINTAPIYEIVKESIYPDDWKIVEGHPSILNDLLSKKKIDMGFVSSFEYGRNPDQYQILGDLSISATGPVGSVTLFSMITPEKLDGKAVLLTGKSATSVSLVKIILEEFFTIKPRYETGDICSPGQQNAPFAAVLAIGDDALRLGLEERYPFQLDLSEVWFERTGLPFVFSVCAVQEDFIRPRPEVARAVQKFLIECRTKGREKMASICQRVAERIPMDCELCATYLKGIEHDLSPDKLKGLELFFDFLIRRQEIPHNALPLKIFN